MSAKRTTIPNLLFIFLFRIHPDQSTAARLRFAEQFWSNTLYLNGGAGAGSPLLSIGCGRQIWANEPFAQKFG
jgi:hypothetical protein